MRARIIWTVTLLLVATAATMATITMRKIHAQYKLKEKVSMLGELPLFKLDSTHYSIKNDQRPIVLVLFNTDCEFCQKEAVALRNSIKQFSGSSIVMVSSEPISLIEGFSTKYDLHNQSNVTFCKINFDKVFEYFGEGPIPRIFVYDGQRRLIKEFVGETKVESIFELIR